MEAVRAENWPERLLDKGVARYPYGNSASSALSVEADIARRPAHLVAAARGTLPSWWDAARRTLDELLRLPLDWDSYGSGAVQPRAVKTAPAIVPTSAGGVDLEWHRGGADLVLHIGPSGELSAWHKDLRSGQEWAGSVTPDLGQLAPILERLG